MPKPDYNITAMTEYCPRCDRPYDSKKTKEASLKLVGEHVDEAHPDMENYISEED